MLHARTSSISTDPPTRESRMFKDIPLAKPWESTVRKSQQLQQQTRRAASFIFSLASVSPATGDSSAAPATSAAEHAPPPPLPPRMSSCDELLLPSALFDDGTDNDDGDDSDDPGGSTLEHAERLLANGDFYTGQWRGSLPHGTGKYLWTDGCMYEGQWRRGKTTGIGKFSWPSGATYEGEFKCGYMDGTGTYTGALGDTYRGCWAMNLKHGHGMKSYANGDYYEGEWRSGLQDGEGRYTWKNGNEYVGNWRAGVIHGQGTLVCANGNRYEGGWEKGLPKGNGSFHWADGGRYVGNWGSENGSVHVQQKGVYHPPSNASSPTVRDPREVFSIALRECTVCPADNVSILPSQKALNWSGVEADFLQKQAAWRSSKSWEESPRSRTSVDDAAVAPGSTPRLPNGHMVTVHNDGGNNVASFRDSNGDTRFDAENSFTVGGGDATEASIDAVAGVGGGAPSSEDLAEVRKRFQRMLKSLPKEVKKQGDSISKGHKNYELMLNLQLGIRHAVGKNAEPTTFDLKASAFDPKDKIWTRFPPEGTKQTPPHQCSEFRWKDYCPLVFRTLRKLFKVDPAEYMLSICGNDALRELSSPGKSGSFFYLTNDDKYMIKTMKKSEVKVLMRMLPAYYNHVRAYENCLVTRFFSLHCVKLTGAIQRKVRFVIMGNLFCSEHIIHRRFDLKGSSLGRITDKPETEIDETTTLKDLDLNFIFRLQKSWFQEFRRQVDRDCEFLEQEWIMDYSLLVGVHFRESPLPQDTDGISDAITESTGATPRLSRASMDQLLCDPTRWAAIKLGSNMPSRVELIERRNDVESPLIGEPTGEFYDVVLYFGIIDILQDYDITKKLEHAYKSFQYDATSISAVDPRLYAKRFRDFVFKVFTEEI